MDDENLCPGWTAWIGDADMTAHMGGKCRPFCRGLTTGFDAPWFPRTSQEPRCNKHLALFSVAGQLPGLQKSGWFLAAKYVRKPADYSPACANACGVLERNFVVTLHACLETLFWDSQRFVDPEAQ